MHLIFITHHLRVLKGGPESWIKKMTCLSRFCYLKSLIIRRTPTSMFMSYSGSSCNEIHAFLTKHNHVSVSLGQVAPEDKTVYLCQKSVITMKNQVRPVCSPKDKIWSRTDKLQRCRRLPLEQAKLRQILKNNSECVLIRKWFDRWYVAESLSYKLRCKISRSHFATTWIPARATNFFCTNIHNIHQDGSILCQALTCLMFEEIPAHFLRPRVLTRCQNPSSSAKTAECRHQPHLLRAVHLRQPRTRRLRTDGVKKRRSF